MEFLVASVISEIYSNLITAMGYVYKEVEKTVYWTIIECSKTFFF